MDAMEFLRDDHRKVLAILDELERVPEDSQPATPDGLEARKRLVTELVMAESAHEAVEEQYFWPSVQHWLADGRELAGPALEQEQSAKRVLDRLDGLEPGDPAFEDLVATVIGDAREHIAYEENEVWPAVRAKVSRTTLEEIGKKMAAAKKAAPTRPHPHTPPSPVALKTAGVAAAAADKLRDSVTGRGKD